jgi:hypothetical protein
VTKTIDATRKSRTHFEQIPVEVVKKIAEADVPNDEKAGTDDVSIAPASRKSTRKSVPAPSADRNER